MAEAFPDNNTTGNTREHKVRQFLAKPPKRATRLVLAAKDEEGSAIVLAEWQKDEVRPELAAAVLELVQEHVIEVGGAIEAKLIYLANDGAEVQSTVIKMQASKIESALDLMTASVQGDGRSLVVQAQVQSLAVQKLYLNSIGQVLSVSQSVASRAHDQAENYLRRIVSLEFELEQIKEALRTAEAIAAAMSPEGGGDVGPIAETQQRMLRLLESVAPILMQKLLSPGAPPAAPPS